MGGGGCLFISKMREVFLLLWDLRDYALILHLDSNGRIQLLVGVYVLWLHSV